MYHSAGYRLGPHRPLILARQLRAPWVRRYIPELLDDVLQGHIHPGRVFDFETDFEQISDAYAAMDRRRAIKSLVRVSTI
jgi:threonine dehydrogenase-like Zn-dependent dehydrogenase